MEIGNEIPINKRFHHWIMFYVEWCSYIGLINQQATNMTIQNAEWFKQGNSYVKHEYLRLLEDVCEKIKVIAVNGGKLNNDEALLTVENNSHIIRNCGINMVVDYYQNKYSCTFQHEPTADTIIQLKKTLASLSSQAQMLVSQVNSLECVQPEMVSDTGK